VTGPLQSAVVKILCFSSPNYSAKKTSLLSQGTLIGTSQVIHMMYSNLPHDYAANHEWTLTNSEGI
jgi:hypothetical protein